MAKQPETLFKEKVQRDLNKLKRCWHVKIQLVALRGIPDVIACINGRFYAFELKVDSPLEPLQEYNIQTINRAGGCASVETPKTWKETYAKLSNA